MLEVGASQKSVAVRLPLLGLTVVACAGPGPGSMHPERSDAAAIDNPSQFSTLGNANPHQAGAMGPALRLIEGKLPTAQAEPQQLHPWISKPHARSTSLFDSMS